MVKNLVFFTFKSFNNGLFSRFFEKVVRKFAAVFVFLEVAAENGSANDPFSAAFFREKTAVI